MSDKNGKPRWKIRALITAIGGVQAIPGRLVDHDFPAPPVRTVAGWFHRDRAPGDWVIALLLIAQKDGLKVGTDLTLLRAEDD